MPEPVNWIPLLAAEVNPAIAASSASYAWTSVPIATPKFVLAVEVLVKSDRLFALTSLASNWVWILDDTLLR